MRGMIVLFANLEPSRTSPTTPAWQERSLRHVFVGGPSCVRGRNQMKYVFASKLADPSKKNRSSISAGARAASHLGVLASAGSREVLSPAATVTDDVTFLHTENAQNLLCSCRKEPFLLQKIHSDLQLMCLKCPREAASRRKTPS